MILRLILCCFLFLYFINPCLGAEIQKLAKSFAKQISHIVSKNSKVTISPYDIISGDGLFYPFSKHLREDLVLELSKRGFKIVPDLEDAEFFIKGKYFIKKAKVIIYLKLISKTGTLISSNKWKISKKEIMSLLEPDIKTYAIYFTKKLKDNLKLRDRNIKIFFTPFEFENSASYPPFSRIFLEEIKSILAKDPEITVMDNEALKKTITKLKTRNIRGIGISNKPKHTLSAQLIDSYSFKGNFWRQKNVIKVYGKILDKDRRVLSTSETTIPFHLIDKKWLKEKPLNINQTTKDLEIEIAPDKGNGSIYTEGETISFVFTTNKPAYVYIYDLNPKNELILLFPCTNHVLLKPRILNFLPQQNQWVIEPPFGIDKVIGFACETPVPFPMDITCGDKVPFDVTDLFSYYRNHCKEYKYSETISTITTKPKIAVPK